MTKNEFTKQALAYLASIGVDLNADNYSWCGDYCCVITQYTHGKLSVPEIMEATDKLSSLLLEGLEGFHLGPLSRNDRISGQIRAMEHLPVTKDKLTYEEKEAFAFCVYYWACTRVYDEDKGCTTMPLYDFESFSKIDRTFREMKTDGIHDVLFKQPRPKVAIGEFGYDTTNPVRAISIADSYDYLNRLVRKDGKASRYRRLGSVSGHEHILDAYEFSFGDETCMIYIDAYSDSSSNIAPEGWALRAQNS